MSKECIRVRKANSLDNMERICTIINEAYREKYKEFGLAKEKRISSVEQE